MSTSEARARAAREAGDDRRRLRRSAAEPRTLHEEAGDHEVPAVPLGSGIDAILAGLGGATARASVVLRAQKVYGNRAVGRILQQTVAQPSTTVVLAGDQSVQRAWSDADTNSYPVPKKPGIAPTPSGGWNAANQMVGTVERIPIEGIKQGLTALTTAQQAADKTVDSSEAPTGKAIACVPSNLIKDQPVEVLLHFHGHNVGYRERSKGDQSKTSGMEAGTVRDVAIDRIEQQVQSSGRNLIAVLPQGTSGSGFGTIDSDAYLAEVWGILVALKKLPSGATRGHVILSGHSGAGKPIATMLTSGGLPADLGELALFDAINDAGQLGVVQTWVLNRMGEDLKHLNDIAKAGVANSAPANETIAEQQKFLANGFRFRAIYTPKYAKTDPTTKQPILGSDGKPIMIGYGVEHEALNAAITGWIAGHTKGLDPGVARALKDNYQVLPAGTGDHNKIIGNNDNLLRALSALPAPPPQPPPPAPPPSAAGAAGP